MTGAASGAREDADRRDHFLDALRARLTRQAGRPALVFPDRTETYGDLDALACRCAARLQALGVAPGDRVAVLTAEKRPFLAAHLGALYAGAVALPLNPRFTHDELHYFLQDSGAKVVVAGGDQIPVVESMRAELAELRAVLPDTDAWSAPERSFSETAVA